MRCSVKERPPFTDVRCFPGSSAHIFTIRTSPRLHNQLCMQSVSRKQSRCFAVLFTSLFLGTLAAQPTALVIGPADDYVLGELPSQLDSIVVRGHCRIDLLADHELTVGKIVVHPGGLLEIGTEKKPLNRRLQVTFTDAAGPAIEVAPGGALSLIGGVGKLTLQPREGGPAAALNVRPGAEYCRLGGALFSGFRGHLAAPVVSWLATPGYVSQCTFRGVGDQLHVDGTNTFSLLNSEFVVTDGRALFIGASGVGAGNLVAGNVFYVSFSARTRVQGKLGANGREAILLGNPLQRFINNHLSVINAAVALRVRPFRKYDEHTWDNAAFQFALAGNTIKNLGPPVGVGLSFGEMRLTGYWESAGNNLSNFAVGAEVLPAGLLLRDWRLTDNGVSLHIGNSDLHDIRFKAGPAQTDERPPITFVDPGRATLYQMTVGERRGELLLQPLTETPFVAPATSAEHKPSATKVSGVRYDGVPSGEGGGTI